MTSSTSSLQDKTQEPLPHRSHPHTLLQALVDFFVRWNRFSGLTSRSGFWWIMLAYVLVTLAYRLLRENLRTPPDEVYSTVAGLTWLLVVIPVLALSCRRLHDAGYPAACLLYGFIPLVGQIILVFLFATRSRPHLVRPEWLDDGPRAPSARGYVVLVQVVLLLCALVQAAIGLNRLHTGQDADTAGDAWTWLSGAAVSAVCYLAVAVPYLAVTLQEGLREGLRW